MKQPTYKVKVQRPIFPEGSPALVYSKCGTIPPTHLPLEGPLKDALGDRDKAYFKCRVEGTLLVILKELRHQNW